MSRSRVGHERAVLILAIAILPWVALSRIGEWRSASAASTPTGSQALESLTSRVVVASDRLSFSFQAKRADGKRQVSTTPPGRIGTSRAVLVAWEVPSSSPIAVIEPIALHLASRGPPPLSTS